MCTTQDFLYNRMILMCDMTSFRDWSLITGRGGGGLQKREGGHMKFYPYEKGAEKVLAMLKGGHNKFWGSFCVVA